MPEYNSIRSYKRQILNKCQFLLNSAIGQYSILRLLCHLLLFDTLLFPKDNLLCFQGRKAGLSRIPAKSPRGRDILTAQQNTALGLCDTNGAGAGPTFHCASGKCPTSSKLFCTSFPRETRHQILHLRAPVYTAAPSYLAGNHFTCSKSPFC